MNWGCFAQIEVVLHRLRLPCTDWGCPAQIEVALHRLRLSCTNFDRIWIDEAFLLWKKEFWPWGLYVEAFLRGSEARRSSWNLDQYKVYIYRVKDFWSEEMANFRVCDGLPMTDTWLNQGGDASMATVASREVSTMPDTPTYSPPTRSLTDGGRSPSIPPDCLNRWWLRVWFTLIKLYIHNPDRQKDPEIRSRGKEQGHESSKGWQLQVSEIKVSERNLLIGPFLHSIPNSITISFRHVTCHWGEGPLEY